MTTENNERGTKRLTVFMIVVLAAIMAWTAFTGQEFTTEEREQILKTAEQVEYLYNCLLYTSPSPRDRTRSRMPSSA